MNEELRKLLDSINAKKKEVKNLAADNKLEEAAKAKEELKNLQAKFDLLYDLEEEEQEEMENKAASGKGIVDKAKEVAAAFVNAIKAGISKKPVAEKDMQILNAMSEGTPADGGLTVPQDISTKIKELRRSEDALEPLVNVETVTTNTGSRVIEKSADQVPFDNVDEAAQFPDASTPQFEKISYTIKKKGGILKVTRELLEDSAENIISYLKKWIAKKAKATRNALIVAQINTITSGKEVAVTGIDDLKKIFNVTLDPAIAANAKVVTNQSGFNWLDTLKDSDGKYVLQPNPTQATQMLLFGKYPITKVSDKVLASTKVMNADGVTVDGYKYPIICGDLAEAITIFDRETLSIEMSTEAGDLWGKDQTGIKVRERLDIQTVDASAIIKAEHSTVGE
jgi:HK97 family phage major capsid protein